MRTEHHKAFEKLIRQASQRHHTWQVFADFYELALGWLGKLPLKVEGSIEP